MTTERNPKRERYRNGLKSFYEINCRSNQSQRITKRKKCLNQQKQLRLLISEMELHGYENESKKDIF